MPALLAGKLQHAVHLPSDSGEMPPSTPIKRLTRHAVGLALNAIAVPAALAHAGEDHAGSHFAWNPDPWIIASLLLTTILYVAGIRRLWRNAGNGAGVPRRTAAMFAAGLAVLAISLVSPIDTISGELFSMHMVQHELMMLVAAPLMVLGRPLAVFLWAFPADWRKRIGRLVRARAVQGPWQLLNLPSVAWLVHAAALWAWHFPSLFQAGLASDGVHAAQHASFLLSSLLFWSSLLGRQTALRYGAAVIYILSTAIHTGILGALLTFSTRIWYPAYTNTAAWGLTALEDQQLGGLIMWVPAGFVFVFAGLAVAFKLLSPQAAPGHAGAGAGQG